MSHQGLSGHVRRGRRAGASAGLTAAVAAGSVLLLAGCGNQPSSEGSGPTGGSSASSPASPSASAAAVPGADQPWLVGVLTAEGADAETTSVTYISYTPSTGQATARKVPGIAGGTGDGADAALLVSADHRWAIPDLDIARDETRTGTIAVWSTTDQTTKKLDLRRLTGQADLKPVAHAFDPQRPEVLRVVDTRDRVWAVDVAADKATSEGRLQQGPWVFTNGFNHNTGVPWVESIDSDATSPAGNGVADTAPVQRSGGTVLPSESDELGKLPKVPCRLSGGFTLSGGTTVAFCADSDSLTAWALPSGATTWQQVGKPSSPVAPAAAGIPLVLPPTT
jgi:hypothetical protein